VQLQFFRFILSKYLKKYSSKFVLGAFMILVLSLMLLPFPLFTKHLLDVTIPKKDIPELFALITIIIFVLVLEKYLIYKQSRLFFEMNSKIVLDIKKDLLKRITKTEYREYQDFDNGYLYSRINTDTERLRTLFADTIINIVKNILTFIVGFCALLFLHWKMALVAFAVLPIFAYSSYYFGSKVKKQATKYYEYSAQTTKQFQDSIRVITLAKLFSNNKFPALRFYKASKISFRSNVKLGKISFLNSAITGFLGQISPIILVGYGGYEIIMGRMSLGELIAFNSFVGYLFGPTASLVHVNVQIQRSRVALKRVQELYELPEEKCDHEFNIPDIITRIELKDIGFSYQVDKPILKSLSFTADKGERIGLVGGSGGGKTTLIKILTGLYTPESGMYLINGLSLKNAQVVALRKCMAVVEQEPMLFNDTIYKNIKLGNVNAGNDDILKAAQKAYAEEFILNLDNRYETIVGNDRLSIGQKQRIAIARALVRKPKILILDEATSNIDAISEKYINQTLEELPKDIIVFIIAHRLSTVRNCDKIIVLENGMIVESGRHDELIKMDGKYKKLFMAANV